MEERHSSFSLESTGTDDLPPQPRSSSADYEPVFQPRPFSIHKTSIHDRSRTSSIESETYVIQIPKDQIFSVPPPENAIIAERYRNPDRKEIPRRELLLCAIVTLVLFVTLLGSTLGALRIIFNPEVPSFSIVHVHASNDTHHSKSHFRYEIALKTANRNERMENIYSSNGHATLAFKGHTIGTGKFPEFDQDAYSTKNIQLGLSSSNGASSLPHDIEKSIGDKKGKQHVNLSLKMNVSVKMMLWNKVIDVACNFKVRSLGSTGKNNVLSQHCQTNFN